MLPFPKCKKSEKHHSLYFALSLIRLFKKKLWLFPSFRGVLLQDRVKNHSKRCKIQSITVLFHSFALREYRFQLNVSNNALIVLCRKKLMTILHIKLQNGRPGISPNVIRSGLYINDLSTYVIMGNFATYTSGAKTYLPCIRGTHTIHCIECHLRTQVHTGKVMSRRQDNPLLTQKPNR